MKKLFKIVLVVLMATLVIGSPASEPELPRMWKISGSVNHGAPLKFYILAVAHSGLSIEYDAYFRNKVLPIFSEADAFSREAAFETPDQAPECPVPLEATAANRAMIQAARERIRSIQLQMLDRIPKPKVPGATEEEQRELDAVQDRFRADASKAQADSYSELGLIWQMRILYDQQFAQDENKSELLSKLARMSSQLHGALLGSGELPPAIVDYLMLYKSGKIAESIDDARDIVDAYCAIGEGRAREFQSEFSNWEYKMDDGELRTIVDQRAKETSLFKESIVHGKLFNDPLADIDSYAGYVCVRNPRWLKTMLSENTNRVTFYALGYAHLFPRSDGKHPCDDLLTMLRNAGLTVELVL